MNAKEKYEEILKSVEHMIIENKLTNHELSDKAFNDANVLMNDRERNALFNFLLGKRVLEYVSERRMMIAYKYMVSDRNWDSASSRAIDISRLADQSGFISKFKKMFGMTPLEAWEKQDPSLYKTIPLWECLSESYEEGNKTMNDRLFDIPVEQLEIIQKSLNLQDFYGLNNEESNFAYELYKNGKEISKCFEYVANYVGNNDSPDKDEKMQVDLLKEDVLYLYFDKGFGFDDIFNILLMQYLKQFRLSIKDCDERFLKGCAEYSDGVIWHDISLDTSYQKKYDYYVENATEEYTDIDFELYILYLNYNDYKSAFSMINPGELDRMGLIQKKEIYGKANETELKAMYGEMDSTYDVDGPFDDDFDERDFDSRVPDVFEDGYEASIPNGEAEIEDEDDWIEEAMESTDEPRKSVNHFDPSIFRMLCIEMSDVTSEKLEKEHKVSKRFRMHNDLDVEKYWKEITDESSLPF